MALRFKLDENLPGDAVSFLRSEGHDVHTVRDERLEGGRDQDVFDASQTEERILVTFDLDFSDIRAYPPEHHHGIWILRPQLQSVSGTVA